MRDDDLCCPECGALLGCDEVDIGVGILKGPPYCTECGWSADDEQRVLGDNQESDDE